MKRYEVMNTALQVEEVRLSDTTVLHLPQWMCVIIAPPVQFLDIGKATGVVVGEIRRMQRAAVETRWAEQRHFDFLAALSAVKVKVGALVSYQMRTFRLVGDFANRKNGSLMSKTRRKRSCAGSRCCAF